MTPDRDLIREMLLNEIDEPEAQDIRTRRAPYEGAHNSPALCAGCGFSLTDPGPCRKCGGTAREVATAFVRRDLSELLDQHQAVQSSRQAAAAKSAPPGSPLAIARASGYPKGSREFIAAYHRAYMAAQKQQSEKAAEKKKKKKP
jgi:hypothetical protein